MPNWATAAFASPLKLCIHVSACSCVRSPCSGRLNHDLDVALDPGCHPDRNGCIRYDLSPRDDGTSGVAAEAAPRVGTAYCAQSVVCRLVPDSRFLRTARLMGDAYYCGAFGRGR